MSQRSDQVFQLSLTEIAFTLVFILLLLLGYLVFREQTAREAAEAALAKVQRAEESTEAMKLAKDDLAQALTSAGAESGGSSLDDVITRLTAAQEVRAERDRLRKQVEDLDAQLSAMTELQNLLKASASKEGAAMDEVISALSLQEQIRKVIGQPTTQAAPPKEPEPDGKADGKLENTRLEKAEGAKASSQRNQHMLEQVRQSITTVSLLKVALKKELGRELTPGQESKTIDAVVAAARDHAVQAKASGGLEATKKENADLRGQVARLLARSRGHRRHRWRRADCAGQHRS